MQQGSWKCGRRACFAMLGTVAIFVASAATPAAAMTMGNLSVLTYNVAGLPLGLSSSTPNLNTVQISPRLNGFDLVAVQEDFGFHADLISQVDYPYLSVKDETDTQLVLDLIPSGLGLGDGLNRMSRSAFADFQRITWSACFGIFTNSSDCLAPKGFSVARHEVTPGAFIDVYNLHADAGSALEDRTVRRQQLRQLYTFMQAFSAGRAVILLGDTNSRYTSDGDILPELLANTGLSDVWTELTRAGSVPGIGPKLDTCVANDLAGGDCERIDKIFYRSGANIDLVATAYQVLNVDFADAAGVPLSDHEPVSAVFRFVTVPEPGTTLLIWIAAAGLALAGGARRTPHGRLDPGLS